MRGYEAICVQDERLDVLPNGSHLTFGSYAEESRPLKRALKQVRLQRLTTCCP
jgi:hypothetical protein